MKTSLIKLTAGTAAVLMASTSLTACSKTEAKSASQTSIVQEAAIQAAATQEAATQEAAIQASAIFTIEKMTCATCPISVKKAMKRVDGVTSVKVDFETKIATVIYDPTLTTPALIAAASTNVGYPASEVIG